MVILLNLLKTYIIGYFHGMIDIDDFPIITGDHVNASLGRDSLALYLVSHHLYRLRTRSDECNAVIRLYKRVIGSIGRQVNKYRGQ